jgi:hypothetical protein
VGNLNDLIVMNPPYVSWELLEKANRSAISDVLGNTLKNGKPNQASAFFYKGIKSPEQGGIIGCVLPTSILSYLQRLLQMHKQTG